jgi:glutamine amidotransferase-like uncharacterized protein
VASFQDLALPETASVKAQLGTTHAALKGLHKEYMMKIF